MESAAHWVIPEPLDTHDVPVDADTVITLRRHGNPDGLRLVLSHGNGLAIDLYYPFWSLLAVDFDLIIYDLRNHGWNVASDIGDHNLPTLVHDHDEIMRAIDLRFGAKPKVGVFHSISALAALLSPDRGENFAARVLFDPPVCKPGRSLQEFEEVATRLAGMVRRRGHRFKSEQELSEVLPFIPNFQNVVPGVYDLFARTTLREVKGEAVYELRCPREYEAQMIDYASIYAVLVDFDTALCPTKVIGADPTLPYSYLPTLDPRDVVTVEYDFLPDSTHFLQLEQPEQCASAMTQYLESINLI